MITVSSTVLGATNILSHLTLTKILPRSEDYFHFTSEQSGAQILDNLSKDTNLQNTRTCIRARISSPVFGLITDYRLPLKEWGSDGK